RDIDGRQNLRVARARPPDERLPLRVLVRARPHADADEVGPRVTRPEDDRRPPLAELAAPTAREGPLLRAELLLRGEQVVARERERREAEVAVVAERGAERAERLGERLAGVRRGHP